MGVFDDKKFEELDWISQATEPIDSVLNEVLNSIPEELVIDYSTYIAMVNSSYSLELDIAIAVDYCINKYSSKVDISWDQRRTLTELFKFESSGSDIILNFENKTIIGEIKLIKLASTLDEKVLESLLGQDGILAVGSMFMNSSSFSRANEIIELLGKCDSGLKTRSERKKKHAIAHRLRALFKNNEWKIKDTELANKVGFWIRDYISDGNLAAFSNFCRLKVMTHRDQPIYSMEEIV
jgi:hypothetical protein